MVSIAVAKNGGQFWNYQSDGSWFLEERLRAGNWEYILFYRQGSDTLFSLQADIRMVT